MLLKTILNRCQKFKCFVYSEVKFTDHQGSACIEAWIEPRKNSKAICSGCHNPAPGYDTNLEPRRFEFIPIWGIPVFFLYFMRRVDCKTCGVRTEQVPWADGKKQLTKVYMQYLANWAQVLSWQEVARRFHTSWEKVFHSVEYVVEWGLKHRSLEGITAIGVDEIAWKKGHKYLTLVYQINNGAVRLLWIGKDRTGKTFHGFFDKLGAEKAKLIEYVCSDMWKAYLKVIKAHPSIGPCFGPIPHCCKAQQGSRSGPCRRAQTNETRRLRSDIKESTRCNLPKSQNLAKGHKLLLRYHFSDLSLLLMIYRDGSHLHLWKRSCSRFLAFTLNSSAR
jgi:hypothetical protein